MLSNLISRYTLKVSGEDDLRFVISTCAGAGSYSNELNRISRRKGFDKKGNNMKESNENM